MLKPNESGAIFGPTPGIARNLQRGIGQFGAPDPQASVAPLASGGGNLNGSSATSILFGKAGTNGSRWQLIRAPRSGAGNYCGTV
jgi:hypothetical protein